MGFVVGFFVSEWMTADFFPDSYDWELQTQSDSVRKLNFH